MTGPSFRTRTAGIAALAVCAGLINYTARAGETTDAKSDKATVTTEQETEYKNWIELGVGGTIVDDDQAQFAQQHHLPGNTAYGGIEDMHYETSLPNDFQLSIDGHALWDIDDYNVRIDLEKAKLGYLRFGFNEFRSWYDGNGGYFPPATGVNAIVQRPNGTFFPPQLEEMYVKRGEAWAELALQIPDWPQIVLHYSHIFREGDKDTTIWGDTTLTGMRPRLVRLINRKVVNLNPTRKIVPGYRDIDETRDIFDLDITKTISSTDLGIGMRYEHDTLDNKLQLERAAGQLPPTVPAPGAQRFITQRDINNGDIFNGHATSETHFTDNLWFTAAYSYSTLGADMGGTRIVGPTPNSNFGPFPNPFPQLQARDEGFLNLAGTSDSQEHVVNANIFWIPFKDLNVIAGFRYTHEDTTADSVFLETATTLTAPIRLTPPEMKTAATQNRLDGFNERVELRYTHIDNWLFYAEGEWEEENGDVFEHQTLEGVDLGTMTKDTYLLGQKYTAGATWYPTTWVNFAGQYYFKSASYDNDFHSEMDAPDTNPDGERNQRLIGQDWGTNDVNVRMTLHPKLPTFLGSMTLVSRYDFMLSSVEAQWAISPTAMRVGKTLTNNFLNEEHTGTISKHVITESINWSPLARLYFTANGAIALEQTKTPVNKMDLIQYTTPTPPTPAIPVFYTSPSVLLARNDYWTVDAGAGYLIDDKTDVRFDYSFYHATNYINNNNVGMPYGMGDTEHIASVTLTRQITKNMRLLAKYSYFNYDDPTSGGKNNYQAHSIYSGLQIRF